MTVPFTHPVQVRYHEVDQQGVVFNMWYLAYLDEAMSEFLDAQGLPYTQMQAAGNDVQLVHCDLDWTSSLRFGPPAEVDVTVTTVGNTSFALGFVVRQGEQVACRARIVYVSVALDGSGKQPLPASLREALSASAGRHHD